ncbi:hypothetical protein Acr_23g0020060 [Actinidia rufa]|uniref:Uncharacterized protein n=1 Tax=Actinidia rufa TaxID=165716 RepID=A0A7J0GS78_9ERIC|nr:hypothetical protein Acr_23g0020060 [Actinidia rufa]
MFLLIHPFLYPPFFSSHSTLCLSLAGRGLAAEGEGVIEDMPNLANIDLLPKLRSIYTSVPLLLFFLLYLVFPSCRQRPEGNRRGRVVEDTLVFATIETLRYGSCVYGSGCGGSPG